MNASAPTRPLVTALTLITFVAAVALWVVLLDSRRWTAGPEQFDIASWQLAGVPGKWLYALGGPLRRNPPADEALATYFALDDRRSSEARTLENTTEAAIEGRLDAALQNLGLPGIPGLSVWPPVDIELTGPPRVLAQSPRERIELVSRTWLRPGLSLDEAAGIEEEAEASAGRSAVVVPTGGISTYPAIVTDGASYADTVEAAAHEWVHHYLSFYPLGWWAAFDREALRTNETVADIVGAEVGAVVLAGSGDMGISVADTDGDRASRVARLADRDSTLRALRLEVDTLLHDGRIEDAERRMEDVRLELAGRGISIRRLNQAYLAWTSTYAARGDSIDVIGGQLREVRRLSGSLPRFLETVRGVTTRADIERALDDLRAQPAP